MGPASTPSNVSNQPVEMWWEVDPAVWKAFRTGAYLNE